MKALVVREPWISLILSGEKTWEMRAKTCNIRGRIGLIRKGSGQVVGVTEIADCLPPISSLADYAATEPMHRVPPEEQREAFTSRWTRPWVLANTKPLHKPVPYAHKSGAVAWVELEPKVAAAVEAQIGVSPTPQTPARTAAPPRATSPRRPRAAPSLGAGEVALTEGNLRNHHFYLRGVLDLFPDDVIGGSHREQLAHRMLTLSFEPGVTCETDIAGPPRNGAKGAAKYIFRCRAAVGDFFSRAGAEPGDVVLIRRDAPYRYAASLRKA